MQELDVVMEPPCGMQGRGSATELSCDMQRRDVVTELSCDMQWRDVVAEPSCDMQAPVCSVHKDGIAVSRKHVKRCS